MGMHYRYKESPGCEVSAFLEGLKMPLLDFYGDFARARIAAESAAGRDWARQ
jgi:hypothetical protein